MPLVTINKDDFPYVDDQAKEILKIIKSNKITVLIANLVIPAYYAARFVKPFNIPVIGVLHSNDTFYKGVIDKFITGTEQDRLTKVVSVSRYIDGLIIGPNGSSDSIVIPCGTPMFSVNVKQRILKDFKIIFAGRLVIEAKQILKVTQAFCNASKRNENYEFNIFGDGDHLKLQKEYFFVNNARITYDSEIAFDDIKQGFLKVINDLELDPSFFDKKENIGTHQVKHYSYYYSRKNRKLVENLYKEDIDFFDFKFEFEEKKLKYLNFHAIK